MWRREEASLLQNIIVIGICMGLGSLIGFWFTARQIVLPEYVGAMIVAAIVRNLDDRSDLSGFRSGTPT